jgi:hypothetical protein
MLSVVMLSAAMLNVIMLSVVAPKKVSNSNERNFTVFNGSEQKKIFLHPISCKVGHFRSSL